MLKQDTEGTESIEQLSTTLQTRVSLGVATWLDGGTHRLAAKVRIQSLVQRIRRGGLFLLLATTRPVATTPTTPTSAPTATAQHSKRGSTRQPTQQQHTQSAV